MKRLVLAFSFCLAFSACMESDTFYKISGRVTGLSGTITLQNNGGDDLKITKNGKFEFDYAIVEGQPFDVTIKYGAAANSCKVSNGKGTVREGMKTVTVTCATGLAGKMWVDPTSLSDYFSLSGENAQEQNVAMDDNGEAIIVWSQFSGTNQEIYKAEYRNGVWTYPTSLSDFISDNPGQSFDPRVAMNNDGDAIIVWQGSDGTNTQIFKAEYRNGAWTFPSAASDNISPDGQNCQNPRVGMDNLGNAIITWAQYDGANYQIFKSDYRLGAWTHPADINDFITFSGNDAYGPAEIKMDDDGEALVVYAQHNGVYFDLFKSEYRSGSWTYPASSANFFNVAGEDSNDPRVAMDDDGNAVIVWNESDGTNRQIFKAEYRSGTWTYPASLADNISPDGQDVYAPEVDMDNNGNTVVVWGQNNGTNNEIYKSEYRSGTWTHPASLVDSITDGDGAVNPSIALNSLGTAIIAWDETVGSVTQIFRAEYRNGAWSFPSSNSDFISPSGQGADIPKVGLDEDDNAIIVWRQSDGSDNQIFKSEYR